MNIKDYPQGLLFDEKLQAEIKERFWNVDSDPEAGKRLFFENAGGSLRLKAVNRAYEEADTFPDCDSRKHPRAKALRQLTLNGFRDLRIMFNAPKYGQIIAEKSSSKVMFEMVRTVLENVRGTNVVVTDLDHPSAYDSVMYYGRKAGMEVRIAKPNKVTGGIDVEEIERLVDKDTALLVCIYASNHTGAVMDMKEIVARARAAKPDLYIISDAVQHMPHGLVDVQDLNLDGINFAAYKIFGCRGFGAGYVSDRLAALDHPGIFGNLGDPWEIGGPHRPCTQALAPSWTMYAGSEAAILTARTEGNCTWKAWSALRCMRGRCCTGPWREQKRFRASAISLMPGLSLTGSPWRTEISSCLSPLTISVVRMRLRSM